MDLSDAEAPYALVVVSDSEYYGPQVKRWLEETALPIVSVDYDAPCNFAVVLDDGVWGIETQGRRLPLPAAMFCRFKMPDTPKISTDEEAAERIRRSEWVAFLSGLTQVLGSRALNNCLFRHAKMVQLALAVEVGFQVPDSTFFLGRDHGLSFARAPTVMKPIGNPNTARFDPGAPADGDVLATTLVSEDALAAVEEDRFKAAPLWFQRRIGSGYEVRAIVVGNKVFAGRERVAIEDRATVDGRFARIRHDPIDLGPVVEKKLVDYMRASGLDYAAFDLMHSDGIYWFLECNPEGQWHSALPHDIDAVVAAVGELLVERASEAHPLDDHGWSAMRSGPSHVGAAFPHTVA